MEKLKLAAPWTTLYREIDNLFYHDSEIKTFFDENNATIKIFVANSVKANALINILPLRKTYGNVEVKIEVVPPNNSVMNVRLGYSHYEYDFQTAFKNNPAFKCVVTISEGLANAMTFVQFAPDVVQFYNDNISDPHGLTSTLYEYIADDVFELPGVFYSTAKVGE